jgi:hypothetical protein
VRALPPAATCAICARPLTDTGGKRVVCCASCGIRRRTIQATLGEFDPRSYPARVLRLTDNYRDVIVWLTGSMWTDEAANRAATSFQRGEQAWVCQRCAGWSVCATCGAPLSKTPAADCVSDDGTVLHAAYFAGFGTTTCSECGTEYRNMKPTSRSENPLDRSPIEADAGER